MALDFKKFILKNKTSSKTNNQEWWTFVDSHGNIEVVVRNWKTGHPIIKGDKYFVHELIKEKIITFDDDENPISEEDKKKYFEDVADAQTSSVYSKPIDGYSL